MRSNTILLAVVVLLVLALLAGGGYMVLSSTSPAVDDGSQTAVDPDGGDDGDGGDGGDTGVDPALPKIGSSDGGDGGLPPPGRREGRVVKAPPLDQAWVAVPPYEELLAKLDWEHVGRTYAELVPSLNDIANSAYRGDVEDERSVERVQKGYGALVDFQMEELSEFGVTPPYRILLHPALMSNCIAATLSARRRGLTEDQLEQLREVAIRHSEIEESEKARAIDPEKPDMRFGVEKDAEYARRLRVYYRDVEAILDAEQRGLLHSDIARDRRYLDAFTAANVWFEGVQIIQYLEPDHVKGHLAGLVMGGVDHRSRDAVLAAVERLANRLPLARLEERKRIIDLMGYVRLDDILFGCDVSLELAAAFDAAAPDDPRARSDPSTLGTPFVLLRDPGE